MVTKVGLGLLALVASGCLVSEKVIRNGRTTAPPEDGVAYGVSTERPDSVRVLMVEIDNAQSAIEDWVEAARNRRDPIRLNCLLDKRKQIVPVVALAKKTELATSAEGATPEYASIQLRSLQDVWTQAQTVKSQARSCPDSQVFEVREVQAIKGPRRLEPKKDEASK